MCALTPGRECIPLLQAANLQQTSKSAYHFHIAAQSTPTGFLLIFCVCHRYGNPLVEIDPKAEAKLRLKIDFMIVPTVSLLYLFCFIDRANIGESTELLRYYRPNICPGSWPDIWRLISAQAMLVSLVSKMI